MSTIGTFIDELMLLGIVSESQSVIEFRKVTKRFGEVVAVADNDLAVKPGEFLSILGPSGCGKTTSLRMMAGFEQPTSGDVFIRGENVTGVPAYRRPVNMVFQHYALFPHLSVADNVSYGLRQRSPRPSEGRDRPRGGRGPRHGAPSRLRQAPHL